MWRVLVGTGHRAEGQEKAEVFRAHPGCAAIQSMFRQFFWGKILWRVFGSLRSRAGTSCENFPALAGLGSVSPVTSVPRATWIQELGPRVAQASCLSARPNGERHDVWFPRLAPPARRGH